MKPFADPDKIRHEMNPQQLLDFYKEMYYFELKRKDTLNSSLGLPIGIVTILAGGVLYYVQNLPALSLDVWTIVFFVTFLLSSICLAAATLFLILALWNHEYSYLPTSSEIEVYRKALVQYYEQNPTVIPGLEEDFHSFLCSQLCKHVEQNTRSNDSKSGYLHDGLGWVIGAIVFLAVSIGPFYKIQPAEKRVQKVEVLNFTPSKEGKVMSEKDAGGSGTGSQKPPPKPTSPSGRVIKEGQQPPPPSKPSEGSKGK